MIDVDGDVARVDAGIGELLSPLQPATAAPTIDAPPRIAYRAFNSAEAKGTFHARSTGRLLRSHRRLLLAARWGAPQLQRRLQPRRRRGDGRVAASGGPHLRQAPHLRSSLHVERLPERLLRAGDGRRPGSPQRARRVHRRPVSRRRRHLPSKTPPPGLAAPIFRAASPTPSSAGPIPTEARSSSPTRGPSTTAASSTRASRAVRPMVA